MIIAFVGPAGCGKDTAAEYLINHHNYTRLSFADPLRDFVFAVDDSIAGVVNEKGWEAAKREHPFVRATLKRIGNAARNHISPNVWLNALESQMSPEADYVITDTRFWNEADMIRNMDGWIVPIIGRGDMGIEDDNNVSQIMSYYEEWTIDNSGDIFQLESAVEDLLETFS